MPEEWRWALRAILPSCLSALSILLRRSRVHVLQSRPVSEKGQIGVPVGVHFAIIQTRQGVKPSSAGTEIIWLFIQRPTIPEVTPHGGHKTIMVCVCRESISSR